MITPIRLMFLAALMGVTFGLPSLRAMDLDPIEIKAPDCTKQLSGQDEYDRACEYVKNNSRRAIKTLFKSQDRNSVFRYALRFAYARMHWKNIDAVRCVEFLRDYKNIGSIQ